MNILKRKKISFYIVILFSSIAFTLLISPYSAFRTITYGLICISLSAIINRINIIVPYNIRKILSFLSGVTVAVVCFKLAQSFCYRWSVQCPENSNPIFYLVYSKNFRTIVSFLLTTLSIPFFFSLFKKLYFFVYLFIKNINSKEFMKYLSLETLPVKTIMAISIIALSSIIAFSLLTALYSLMPTFNKSRMVESVLEISKEGENPSLFEWCTSALDNWTDSMMMLFASNDKVNSSVNRALLNYYGYFSNATPVDYLEKHFINNISYDGFGTYARYWHGYLVILRPLLSVFSYHEIRVINAIIQTLLTLIILFLLHYRKLSHLILPYIISICMLMPIVISKSLQFSSCFYLFSIISILILIFGNDKRMDSRRLFSFIFLMSGILTSFFDFLTYPLSTYGIPMIIYISLYKNKQFEKSLSDFIKNSSLWLLGYVGMWVCKWILADIFTSDNVISEGIENVLVRTSASGYGNIYSLIEVEYQNLRAFFKTPITIVAILLIVTVLFSLRKHKDESAIKSTVLYNQVSFYIIIAILPIAWYAVLLNHSAIHTFFTNKTCVVLVFAVLSIFSTLYHEIKHQCKN